MMLLSEALARLLTHDDHCYRGLFLMLWEAACGSCGHVVAWDMLVALVISLPMIENDSVVQMASLHYLHCLCLEEAEPRFVEANLGIVILQGPLHPP